MKDKNIGLLKRVWIISVVLILLLAFLPLPNGVVSGTIMVDMKLEAGWNLKGMPKSMTASDLALKSDYITSIVHRTSDGYYETYIPSIGITDFTLEVNEGVFIYSETDTTITFIISPSSGYMGGDLIVTGDLNVTGDCVFDKNLTVIGSMSVAGSFKANSLNVTEDLTVEGDLTVNEDLAVGGDLTVDGNLIVAKDLTVGSMTITEDMTINDDLTVSGDATIDGDSTVVGDMVVGGNLTAGDFTVDNLTISDDLEIDGNLSVGGYATIGDDLTVTGDAVIAGNLTAGNFSVGNLTIAEDLTINGNLSVSGDSTIGGDSTVLGDMVVVGKLTAGDFTVGNLTITDNLAIEGNLMVDKDIIGYGNLLITGDAIIGGNLTVGNFTVDFLTIVEELSVGGNLSIGGNTFIDGDLTVNGTLMADKDVQINGNLSVIQDTTIGGYLTVTGDGTFENDLTVNGNLTVFNLVSNIVSENYVVGNLTITENVTGLAFSETADYMIFIDSGVVHAKNGATGNIDFQSTNPSYVIQSSIDALPASGGKIYIKAGTYNCPSALRIEHWKDPNNGTITLEGEGFNKNTVLKLTSASDLLTFVSLNGSSHLQFRNLAFQVNKKADYGIRMERDASGQQAGNHIFENVIVTNAKKVGILIYGSENVHLSNVYATYGNPIGMIVTSKPPVDDPTVINSASVDVSAPSISTGGTTLDNCKLGHLGTTTKAALIAYGSHLRVFGGYAETLPDAEAVLILDEMLNQNIFDGVWIDAGPNIGFRIGNYPSSGNWPSILTITSLTARAMNGTSIIEAEYLSGSVIHGITTSKSGGKIVLGSTTRRNFVAGFINTPAGEYLTVEDYGIGNSIYQATVTIGYDLRVKGNLDVTGDLSVGGDMSVSGDMEVTGNLTVTGNIIGAIGRTATFTIAASDSNPLSKNQADYVCDGTNDEEELQTALDAISTTGGRIVLMEGNYYWSSAPTYYSNIIVEGQGAGTVIVLNADIVPFCFHNIERSTIRDLDVSVTDGHTEAIIETISDGATGKVIYCTFENIFIRNIYGEPNHYYTGIRVKMDNSRYQYMNTYENIYMDWCKKGIHIQAIDGSTWMNGNLFEKIMVWGYETFIDFEISATATNIANRNTFIDVKCQTRPYSIDGVKNIQRNGNIFIDCLVWDWWVATNPNYAWSISADARDTVIIGSAHGPSSPDVLDESPDTEWIVPGEVDNSGTATVSNGSWISHGLGVVPSTIILTAYGPEDVWIMAKNDTQFQVGVETGSVQIDWYAKL